MSDSDQLGDLDLEKIAREALASETSDGNEGASGISTTKKGAADDELLMRFPFPAASSCAFHCV